MDPLVSSSLISAGSSLLGGALGGGEKRPRYQPYIKALTGKKGITLSQAEAEHHANMVASDWNAKMDSAKKHGIHPLALLGAPAASFNSPQAVVSGGRGSKWGDAIGAAGQDIGRAFAAHATREERASAALHSKLSLERAGLENELLRSQIRAVNAPGSPPGRPGAQFTPGQGDVQIIPKEIVANAGVAEKGISPSDKHVRFTDLGRKVRVRSDAMADAGVDDGPAAWVYDLTRTIPDMFFSTAENYGRKANKWIRKNFKWR